jgi:hypothetical protein
MIFSRIFKPQSLPAKAWIIDPETKSITEIQEPNMKLLVPEIVGDDAESFNLDNNDNVVWLSDTDTNERYAFYFEMPYPFDVRRYSKGLVVSLGPAYWSEEAIQNWLVWYDKENVCGDV